MLYGRADQSFYTREIAREEVADALTALGIRAINATVSADHQAIEVIDQTWVPRFRPRDRQVGGGPPVDATQLAHLFAVQLAQRHPVEQMQQLLESLPDVFALADEPVVGHEAIANCQLPISDWRFSI